MAISVKLADGSIEYLCHEEGTDQYHNEMQRIIRDKLGDDVERYVKDLKEAANETQLRISTDLDCYESELESNTNSFLDILKKLNEMDMLLMQQRLNEAELIRIADAIRRIINNNQI